MFTHSAVDSFSFSMNIFQFFTKPKPPKGYYIYGDVGKRHIVKKKIPEFSFKHVCFCDLLIIRVFQAQGKQW